LAGSAKINSNLLAVFSQIFDSGGAFVNPPELGYTSEHEWVRFNDDGTATMGITDFAQEQLGDIVYVEFPKIGDQLVQGEKFGEVESVKSVSDLFAAISGELIEINKRLEREPELVNDDPYGEGWMVKVTVKDAGERSKLLSAEDYEAIAQ
jgi:glycine cleavage system H protein